MKQLLIVGGGGFSAEVAWIAEEMSKEKPLPEQWKIIGCADDNESKMGTERYGYSILGSPEALAGNLEGEVWYCCAVSNNKTRENIVARLEKLGWRAATIIHPSVIFAKNTEVGEGSYIGPLSIISPNARIGKHVLINNRVAVGHDATMEDFSQACPGAQINGGCKIGHGAMIGSNASIHQLTSVGAYSTVGSNSQVIMKVKPGTTVNGVPARLLCKSD
jgi:sugar O-acyltransferase (sialic acid O-acetyltransferase NeuD family)